MTTAELKSMKASWTTTVQRCTNPNNPDFKYYGARGIHVCERWRVFENFLTDMGPRPPGMTLERVDVNGPYSPENCVWATRAQQAANRRANTLITWDGRTQCVAHWERELGLRPGTLKARLTRLNYDVQTAMTKPVKCGGRVQGREYAPRKWGGRRGPQPALRALSPSDVRVCKAAWVEGASFSAIGRTFGVCTTTVSKACKGYGAYQGA